MNTKQHFLALRDRRLKKKLFNIILFIAYPAYIVHSCITSPFFTVFDSNVMTEALAIMFYALNTIIDLFVFFLSYSVIIYGLYRLSFNEIRPTFYLAMLAPFFKYALKLIVSPFVDGVVDTSQLLMVIYSLGVSGILEILQFLCIILISKKYIYRYKGMEAVVAKASTRIAANGAPDMSVLPFKSLFSLKNPLQRGAFAAGLVVSLVRVAMLLINDISKGIYIASIGEILLFIGGYIIELSVGVLGYLMLVYVFVSIGTKDE